MTVVFADTAFYVALLSSRDALHAAAVEFLPGYSGRIVTTEFILLEVANFHSRPPDRQRFFARRPDKHWSLTDCTSFVVMTDQKLSDALTADEHFEQAGFRAMLKPAPAT